MTGGISSFLWPWVLATGLAGTLLTGCAGQGHHGEAAGITAAAFGDIYDISDGAKPVMKGGGCGDTDASGDTWYSTWGRDDTAYLIHDDGKGFSNVGNLFARHRLCGLDETPNTSTDGFCGVNLNPGILGNTMPHYENTPAWARSNSMPAGIPGDGSSSRCAYDIK